MNAVIFRTKAFMNAYAEICAVLRSRTTRVHKNYAPIASLPTITITDPYALALGWTFILISTRFQRRNIYDHDS
jgi:hypothetical protein